MGENQDRYEIRDVLGQGAMGVVYRAWDTALNRLVALKVMAASLSSNTELRIRFYREARSAAQLTHPNIVTIYDFGETTNQVFIAMELVEGSGLKEVMKLSLALDQKLDIMVQICRALAFAHQNGVVHRDVKPGNLLVTSGGIVKILDFGVAHLATSELTQTGTRLGTPEYMSPEMIEGAKVDHRSDVFSCGIVFYELLTGTKPFYDDSLTALMDKIIGRDLPPVSQLVPDVPPPLDRVIQKMLEKTPAQRYQSLDETIADLKELQAELLLVKADRIRELKTLHQSLIKLQTEASADEFCRAIIDQEQGQKLREAKESVRNLSDPSHASVTLQALDYGKASLEEKIDSFRDFLATELPARVTKRDELIQELQTAVETQDFHRGEEILALLQKQGCPESFLQNWRERIQAQRDENARREREAKVAERIATARERAERQSFGSALEALREALALDPANAEAVRFQQELSSLLAKKDRLKPSPVPPPLPPARGEEAKRSTTGPGVASEQQAGSGVLQNLVKDFLSEAQEDLRKKDYSSCRKNLKRVLQLFPHHDHALEMLAKLDRVENNEATVLASWKDAEPAPAGPRPNESQVPVRERLVPAEAGSTSHPRSIPKRGLIIASGVVLVALLISIPFWMPRQSGTTGDRERSAAVDHRVAQAISSQSYKTEAALPSVIEDIRSLAGSEGGQGRAESYLKTIRESYLAAARNCEEQKDWQGALRNYRVLAGLLQAPEYQGKVSEVSGFIQATGQTPPVLPETPVVTPPPKPEVSKPRAPVKETTNQLTVLDQKIGEAMRAGTYAKADGLPALVQEVRQLADLPGGSQKAGSYLTAIQGFYLGEARRLEAAGDRRRALQNYRVLIDVLGESEHQGKAAELSRLLESEPLQKDVEALEDRISASMRSQNLLPPARDNAWDLIGQLQKIRPGHSRITSFKSTIRQRLESRVAEALEANKFGEASEQLKKLAGYFPEDRSRWEQREADIRKTFLQREFVFPALHIHSENSYCEGKLHFTQAAIRYSTSGNHSRTLAFGAMSRVQQTSDRLTVTLKMGSSYEFRYSSPADAKFAEEWFKFRETLPK